MALANQVGLSNKCVSERHAIASMSKYTAGEAVKQLKKLGVKTTAKEIVEAYKLINGYYPEWHHSGFYKLNGKSTMGKTYFFTDEQIKELFENWALFQAKKEDILLEINRKENTIIKGVYWFWDSDYSGKYGKKVNFKRLGIYEGNELSKPNNFIQLDDETFEKASLAKGRKYTGWDEPKISEFQ